MDFWKILTDTAFKTPYSILTRLFQSKMGMFVYGIMSQWYIVIAIGSSVVVFWVFKGLEETGVLSESLQIVKEAIEDSKAIAQHCTPKIRNLEAMWECIQNPPKYQRTKSEQEIYDKIEQEIQQNLQSKEEVDPYEN